MTIKYAAHKEMILTLALLDVLMLAAGIWFVPSKTVWVLSIVLGFVASVCYVSGMMTAIEKSVATYEKGGNPDRLYRLHTVIRYLIMALVLVVACISDYLSPIVVFVCLIFVKIAAYLNPIVHRILTKGEEQSGGAPEDIAGGDVQNVTGDDEEEIRGVFGLREDPSEDNSF